MFQPIVPELRFCKFSPSPNLLEDIIKKVRILGGGTHLPWRCPTQGGRCAVGDLGWTSSLASGGSRQGWQTVWLRRAIPETPANLFPGAQVPADPLSRPLPGAKCLGSRRPWPAGLVHSGCPHVCRWWASGPCPPPAGRLWRTVPNSPHCLSQEGLDTVAHWWIFEPGVPLLVAPDEQHSLPARHALPRVAVPLALARPACREPLACQLCAGCPLAGVAPGTPSGEMAALAPQPLFVVSRRPAQWLPLSPPTDCGLRMPTACRRGRGSARRYRSTTTRSATWAALGFPASNQCWARRVSSAAWARAVNRPLYSHVRKSWAAAMGDRPTRARISLRSSLYESAWLTGSEK